jgi:hypothetical protein
VITPTCEECGASAAIKPCAEHFSELLALDLSRVQPFAAHHGLNVACYLLQHPSQGPGSALPVQWLAATTFVREGLDAMRRLQQRAVERNNHGYSKAPYADIAPADSDRPTAPFSVGIEDVSVDGSYPAEGYELRMRRWADAVVGSAP